MIALHFRLEGDRHFFLHVTSDSVTLAITEALSSVSHRFTYDEAQAIGLALIGAVQDRDEQLPT